jgi:hypothetical protein
LRNKRSKVKFKDIENNCAEHIAETVTGRGILLALKLA